MKQTIRALFAPKFDIDAALKEVQEKTEEQIEHETAYKWGSRAIACYVLYNETQRVRWFIKGEDYRHEAIEHAALMMDGGKLVGTILGEINKYRREPE